ncbi:MAG: glycosyltransferase family 2 protein [Candidatus Woesearchaeota archaeon]
MKISIITPNYNYAKYIAQTIESVVTQDYENIEHIIVDDGSTDNSVEIIKNYQEKYPGKIKLIKQENRGQTPAINVGLKAATGDIIGWINSDDYYCPSIFSKIIDIFIKNNNIDILYGNVNVVDKKGLFIFRKRNLNYNFLECCFSGFANCFTSNSFFWRKDCITQNELLNESFKCNMDGEFISRIVIGKNIFFLDEPLANFRKQDFTITSQRFSNWNIIVKKEIEYELRNSYQRLKISKIVPYNYNQIIKYIFRFKRIIKRIIKLHYLYEYIEKKKYNKSKNCNCY